MLRWFVLTQHICGFGFFYANLAQDLLFSFLFHSTLSGKGLSQIAPMSRSSILGKHGQVIYDMIPDTWGVKRAHDEELLEH